MKVIEKEKRNLLIELVIFIVVTVAFIFYVPSLM